jgi:hypothetical protein
MAMLPAIEPLLTPQASVLAGVAGIAGRGRPTMGRRRSAAARSERLIEREQFALVPLVPAYIRKTPKRVSGIGA